jgi:predicted dehydrogenase
MAEAVAVANEHPESMKRLARDFGVSKAYDVFDDLAQDPEIDAVVIGVPNYLNGPLSIKFLRSGKHVLCEKPMALSSEEAKEMIRASEESGNKLTIAHVWRSDPEVRWLREVVRSGKLGRIYKVKLHAVSAGWGPQRGSWRTQRSLAGGGALTDVGIHSMDTLSFLFDDGLELRRVYCRTENVFLDADVEDSATVLMEFQNGMTVSLDAGWYEPNVQSLHGAVEIFGDKGYARTLPTQLRHECDGLHGRFEPMPPREAHVSFSMFQYQMNHFIESVLEDKESVCDGRDALPGIRWLEAAYKSAETGGFFDIAATTSD